MVYALNRRGWVFTFLTGLSLSGCDSGARPKSVPSAPAASELDSVRDLTQDEYARKVIAAQTEMESGRAPGACTDLLLADGKDLFVATSSSQESEKLREIICSMDDIQLTHFLIESHGQKHGQSYGGGLLVDTITKYGPIKGDLKFNSAKNDEYSEEFAKYDANIVRKFYCHDRSSESYKAGAASSFQQVMSSVTLEKYNTCVRAKSYGLHCDITPTKLAVSVNLRWEPTELVRDLLPVVALDWSGMANLQAEGPLPITLGIGSGIAMSFKRVDPEELSVVAATGSDRGKNFNFACRVQVSKFDADAKTPRFGRFAECGVEAFKFSSGPECGIKSHVAARSAACGIESYTKTRSRACGVESYKARHDCDICGRDGLFGGCNKCSHWSFGVQSFKECADPSHGVYQYRSCEHPSHGVASYNSCRHQNFGVEQYKECIL